MDTDEPIDEPTDELVPESDSQTSTAPVVAPAAILEMRDVSLRREQRDARLRRVNFTLGSGELVLIRRPPGQTKQLLASAALGLLTPTRGEVLFDGLDWQKCSYRQQTEMRSRVGRVFDFDGWLLNMTVLDNITLAQQYHGDEDDEVLLQRVADLMKRFGLSLPKQQPAYVERWRLRICQWTRVMLGKPQLLILERPLDDVPRKYHRQFYIVESEYRAAGGATMWITDSPQVWDEASLADAQRFEIKEQNLIRSERRSDHD